MIFGTFDRLHPGHRFLLEEAGKRGELGVVVARDHNVERIKGRRPQQPERERAAAIGAAYPSAAVIMGDPGDFLAPVRAFRPDRILLGYDQELPPGVAMDDLGAPVERIAAFRPEEYKSSLRKTKPGLHSWPCAGE